jgi:hypothetical protein
MVPFSHERGKIWVPGSISAPHADDEPNGVYKVMESEHICHRVSFKNLKFIHIILSKLQNQYTYEYFVFIRENCSAEGQNLTKFGRGILSNFDSKLGFEKSLRIICIF